MKLLVECGADVNALGGRSRGTALHAAAAVGHASTAEILLGSGADPRAKDGVLGDSGSMGEVFRTPIWRTD